MDKKAIINAYVRRIKRGVIAINDVHISVRKDVYEALQKPTEGGASPCQEVSQIQWPE